MILCPVCGTRNEDRALFCGECGNKFVIPEGAEHDFTRGVMRYAPDRDDAAGGHPVYLTAQAAEAFRATDAQESATPVTKNAFAVKPAMPAPAPVQQGIPAGIPPVPNVQKNRKKHGKTAAIVIMSVIGILVILIIFGIVILLGS